MCCYSLDEQGIVMSPLIAWKPVNGEKRTAGLQDSPLSVVVRQEIVQHVAPYEQPQTVLFTFLFVCGWNKWDTARYREDVCLSVGVRQAGCF